MKKLFAKIKLNYIRWLISQPQYNKSRAIYMVALFLYSNLAKSMELGLLKRKLRFMIQL